MARQVLAFGAVAVLLLLTAWVAYLVMLSEFAPMMHPPLSRTDFVIHALQNGEGAPFAGMGKVVLFWFALLCAGVASDFYMKRAHRALVEPFAMALGTSTGVSTPLQQTWEGFAFTTCTAGTHEQRRVRVQIRQFGGSRTRPTLNVEVECAYPGTLNIRRRGLRFFLLSPIGTSATSLDIQYPELEHLVSLQADDPDAVRTWIRTPAVRNRIVDMFQAKGVDLLTFAYTPGGRVLRAVYSRLLSERAEIQRTASAVLAEITALAGSCESMATTAR